MISHGPDYYQEEWRLVKLCLVLLAWLVGVLVYLGVTCNIFRF